MIDHDWHILIPQQVAELMPIMGAWGTVTSRVSSPHRAARVLAVSAANEVPTRVEEDRLAFLSSADAQGTGYWYRVDGDVATIAYFMSRQRTTVAFDAFRNWVPEARSPGRSWYIAITYCESPPGLGDSRTLPQYSAWFVSSTEVRPISSDVESVRTGLDLLQPQWDTDTLQHRRVLLVGAGSIGGASAMALGGYGLGEVALLDPDRLRYHNVIRHVATNRDVGRFKVDAVAELMAEGWPQTRILPLGADVIHDADVARSEVELADIVVCTVDGVEPRRVVNYLCRRAGKPVIFACVLDDGRYGEVLRLRPLPEVGCLECQRARLEASGGIAAEGSLDRGYGEGTRHNPMTAVGTDLHIVGSLAAKAAVATLLEGEGHWDQLLEDDNVVWPLRPEPGRPFPFDSRRQLAARWYRAYPSREECRTCHPAW